MILSVSGRALKFRDNAHNVFMCLVRELLKGDIRAL